MTTRSLSETQLRAIGRRVKAGRKRRKMSQYDLAIELRQRLPLSNKVSPAVISRIEAGTVEAGLDTIAGLAVVLDLTLVEMAPEYVDDATRMHSVLTLVVGRGQAGATSSWVTEIRGVWPTLPTIDRRRLARPVVEILMSNESPALLAKAS